MKPSASGLSRLHLALASPTLGDVMRDVAKAHATRKLQRRFKWQGLSISIENDRGSTRKGVDPDGRAWETHMTRPYGYIKGTHAVDGDHYDCFVREEGLDLDPQHSYVWIVHLRDPHSGGYDEDKAFIGFESERDVRDCFRDHYDNPDRYFGAISILPAADFVAWCKNKENWGRSPVRNPHLKVRLHARQVEKAKAALDEHISWLRGVVQVAKAGGPFDACDDESGVPDREHDTFKALELADQVFHVAKAAVIDDDTGRRLLKITPGWDAIDIENQAIVKDVLRDAWPYYEKSGNVDLEHLTKKGGDTLDEYKKILRAQGFPTESVLGRDYFEIGRPVAGSFDHEECSFIAEIYQGTPVADEFWRTVQAGWVWRPSVGGAARYAKVVAKNHDHLFPRLQGRKQEFELARMFRWNNVGLTLEPVNHHVLPVETVSERELTGRLKPVSKGITVEHDTPTTTAADVLKGVLHQTATSLISTLLDSEQISHNDALALTAEVSKALGALGESEAMEREVVKALDYGGAITMDAASMGAAQAALRSGLSDYQKEKKAKQFYEATLEGWTPFQKGYQPSEDGLMVDVADFLMQEERLGDDDALDVAGRFLGRVAKAARGE